MKQSCPLLGLGRLCSLFGLTRQAYYQQSRRDLGLELKSRVTLELVAKIRKQQPKIGVRKLYFLIQQDMRHHQIKIGRDGLFDLMAARGLLVQKRKRLIKTTNSQHWHRKYDNLIKEVVPNKRDQLWASDITYIPVAGSFCYLSLVTDIYSHKIVGFNVSENLAADGCIKSLNMALKGRSVTSNLIHHSDRGIQYCCTEYVKILQANNVSISMTQNSDPYENAIAERVNGILKEELLQDKYSDYTSANKAIKAAIATYNNKRPHMSCDMLTPAAAHLKKGPLKRRWKNKIYKRLILKPTVNLF